MGIKSRSNYGTGGINKSEKEWNDMLKLDEREIENARSRERISDVYLKGESTPMSDALTEIERGTYFSGKSKTEGTSGTGKKVPSTIEEEINRNNEKIIDKVINNSDMYEYHANETLQITLRIMNAFSIINLPVTKETAFEFLKALELENIVIMEK